MACPHANETVPEGKVARLMTVEDEINEQIQITGSKGVAQLCALIEARVAEFNSVNVAKAFRWVLQGQTNANETRRVVDHALRVLEESAVQNLAGFKAKEVVNILHAMAKTRYNTENSKLITLLYDRAEAVAGTFNAQAVANTLWAYATMGREPGAVLMRELAGLMGTSVF